MRKMGVLLLIVGIFIFMTASCDIFNGNGSNGKSQPEPAWEEPAETEEITPVEEQPSEPEIAESGDLSGETTESEAIPAPEEEDTANSSPENPPPPVKNFPQRVTVMEGGGCDSFCGITFSEEAVFEPPIPRVEFEDFGGICILGAPFGNSNSTTPIFISLSHPQYEVGANFTIISDENKTNIYLNDNYDQDVSHVICGTADRGNHWYFAGTHHGIALDTNIFEISLRLNPIFPEGNYSIDIQWPDQFFTGDYLFSPDHLIDVRPDEELYLFDHVRHEFQRNETVVIDGAGFEPDEWLDFGIYFKGSQEESTLHQTIQIQTNEDGRFEYKLFIDETFQDGFYYVVDDPERTLGAPTNFTIVDDLQNNMAENKNNQETRAEENELPNNGQVNILMVFDDNLAAVINSSQENISLEGVIFKRVTDSGDVSAEFEARYWGHDYAMGPISALPPDNCLIIHIDKKFSRPSQCGNAYSWLQRSSNNPQNHFWIPRSDSSEFQVWQYDRLIHTCDIYNGSCEFYLPQP